jgi:hypothetical protein
MTRKLPDICWGEYGSTRNEPSISWELPPGVLMRPERPFPIQKAPARAQGQCKVVSGRFGVIGEIAVLTGRGAMMDGRANRAAPLSGTVSDSSLRSE